MARDLQGIVPFHGASIYSMTAKEKLRAQVEGLSEQEAEATLDFIASRGQNFADWLDARPEDDEQLSAEDEAALAESDADITAGQTVSYEQVKQDLGSQAGRAAACASRAVPRRICAALIRQSASVFSPASIDSSRRIARST